MHIKRSSEDLSKDDIYKFQAEVCKLFANPNRIKILMALQDGEKTLNELARILRSTASNICQHLDMMSARGMLRNRRQGNYVYYSIANDKIGKACSLMMDSVKEILIADKGIKIGLLKSLKLTKNGEII
ncbi:MAG: metalloregulator ArsR/SmtB family transcription factor [Thermodesulfovibrionales bacterium]|nr:metalloregulator ArsR/SmtB family transcription factor [Thermodesulfovibrionales bacterium]